MFNFGAGFYINGKTDNFIVQVLRTISPFRYACEQIIRILLKDKKYVEKIFDSFNYNLGSEQCVKVCLTISAVFFILSWIALQYKTYRLLN